MSPFARTFALREALAERLAASSSGLTVHELVLAVTGDPGRDRPPSHPEVFEALSALIADGRASCRREWRVKRADDRDLSVGYWAHCYRSKGGK